MISKNDFKECGIAVSDELIANAALEYLKNNTTLPVDLENVATVKALPFSAKLFIQKYEEILSTSSVIASESIEGLSQSFKNGDKAAMLDDLLNSLIDEKYLLGQVQFVPSKKRWN